MDNIFQDCQPVVLFARNNIYTQKIAAVSYNKFKFIDVDSADFEKFRAEQAQGVSWPQVSETDTASLIYTSGTTAKPKGVVLSHYNFCSNFRGINQLNICSCGDNFLSILPLFHTYAFMVTFLLPLLMGAKITYAKSFKPQDLARIIKETQISVLVGVPQLFSLIHRAIFEKLDKIPRLIRFLIMPLVRNKVRHEFGKNLRLLISGGARLDVCVGRDLFSLGVKFIEGYGLTETSPVATFNPPEKTKFGSVGKPLPGVQVRILDPDESGVGQVLIKGPNVMQGYFKRPDLTNEVLSKDGWFNSQDLGRIDKHGYLFLTGRKKDVIVLASGKNIYPTELEEYYNQSSKIKEICILQKLQEQFGKQQALLFALVVPDFEYFRKQNKVNIQENIRWELENLSAKLPPYKRILGFAISKQELPRTRLRKIKRHQINQKLLNEAGKEQIKKEELSLEDKVILSSDAAQKTIKYLFRQLNKRVDLDSHLEIDLGIDSLGRVELSAGLERLFLIKIPHGYINKALTVKDIIINVEQARSEVTDTIDSYEIQTQDTWDKILSQDVPLETLKKIKINSGVFDKLLTGLFKCLFSLAFGAFWHLETKGKEFLPRKGPYIICPNHNSYLDGFALFAALPPECVINLFLIGHANIFEHPLVRWTIKLARLIAIDPVKHLVQSLQAARFVLGHKKIICIFPEGSRSIDGNMQEFKRGVGILAKELNVPIVPVWIEGTQHAWPRTRKIPRTFILNPIAKKIFKKTGLCSGIKVNFGKPLRWQTLGEDYAVIVKTLREKVLELRAI